MNINEIRYWKRQRETAEREWQRYLDTLDVPGLWDELDLVEDSKPFGDTPIHDRKIRMIQVELKKRGQYVGDLDDGWEDSEYDDWEDND